MSFLYSNFADIRKRRKNAFLNMIEDGRVKCLNSIFSVIMYDLRKNRVREWMVIGEENKSEASIFRVGKKDIK